MKTEEWQWPIGIDVTVWYYELKDFTVKSLEKPSLKGFIETIDKKIISVKKNPYSMDTIPPHEGRVYSSIKDLPLDLRDKDNLNIPIKAIRDRLDYNYLNMP